MNYTTALTVLNQSDPILATLIGRIGPCTLNQQQQQGTLLSALCESILYQQLSGKAAAIIHRRFLALYPDKPLPTAEDILATPNEQIRATGVSGSKVIYLKDLAQKVLDGLPSLTELETMDDESIIDILTQVKGIGRWTVQMLLIFRLHRWDVLPVDDLGIRNAIRILYNLPELPSQKTVAHIGQPWQPYRTIASWYLWRSLDI
jgi:DNA-3-methyladenine glycosylase II